MLRNENTSRYIFRLFAGRKVVSSLNIVKLKSLSELFLTSMQKRKKMMTTGRTLILNKTKNRTMFFLSMDLQHRPQVHDVKSVRQVNKFVSIQILLTGSLKLTPLARSNS